MGTRWFRGVTQRRWRCCPDRWARHAAATRSAAAHPAPVAPATRLGAYSLCPRRSLAALLVLTGSLCRAQLNVDILVTGHTHDNKVMKYEGKYYINPGSITGAYSGVTP